MSANILPNELLDKILRNLSGKDLLSCQRVCQRWKIVIDGFGDMWRKFCSRQYRLIYKDAYKKAGLSWCELYESLTLWDQLSTANVRVHQIQVSKTDKFQILPNAIISCPQKNKGKKINQRTDNSVTIDGYDKILYFSLATLKELRKDQLRFTFQDYEETEHFLILCEYQDFPNSVSKIHVIPRANKRKVLKETCKQCLVSDNKIYYTKYDDDDHELEGLYVTEVVVESNNVSFKTRKLLNSFEEEQTPDILDIAEVSDCEVNILTENYDVYFANNLQLELVCSRILQQCNPWHCFGKYGFNVKEIKLQIVSKKIREAFGVHCDLMYQNVIITGTHSDTPIVQIYYNPYTPDGKIELFNRIPDKTITLGSCACKVDPERFGNSDPMPQIDIVEIEKGHMIVVVCCGRIFVIELRHDVWRKRAAVTRGGGARALKRARTAAPAYSLRQRKHNYNLRSAATRPMRPP